MMFRYVINNQVIKVIELLEELIINGRELTQFVSDFTWYLRNLLLIKTSKEAPSIIDASKEQMELLQEEASLCEIELLMRYIRVLSELSNQMKYASQKRVLVEVAFIKLCKPAMETNYDSILDRIRLIEKQLEDGIVIANENRVSHTENVIEQKLKEQTSEEMKLDYELAVPEDLKEVAQNWNKIMVGLPRAVSAMMTTVKPSIGEDNTLLLLFSDPLEKEFVGTKEHLKDIESVIRFQIQKEVKVSVHYISEEKKTTNSMIDLRKVIKNIEIEYE